MKMNKKGIGGFFEAMVAMMVVCIAMTSFFGVLAYNQIDDVPHDIDFEEIVINNVSLDGDRIIFDDSQINDAMDRYGLDKVTVKIVVQTADGAVTFFNDYDTGNSLLSDTVYADEGSFIIHSADGMSFVSTYEVGYWSN